MIGTSIKRTRFLNIHMQHTETVYHWLVSDGRNVTDGSLRVRIYRPT